MVKFDKKTQHKELVLKNVLLLLELSKNVQLQPFHTQYIKQLVDLTKAFNIRLTREQKLLFCKNCMIPWNSKTRSIRLNSIHGTKDYICLECGFVRKFKYKK